MKWIAIVLVLLNVIAYLMGGRSGPDNAENVAQTSHEEVNAAAMSVVAPEKKGASENAIPEIDANILSEDGIAQLKVNQKGAVLVARSEEKTVAPIKQLEEVVAKSEPVKKSEPTSDPQVKATKEPEPKSVAKAPAQKTVEVASAAPKADAPAAVPAAKEALACYRVGPFTQRKTLVSTRQTLVNNGIAFKLDEKKTKGKATGTKVYLGGFANTGALNQQKKQLQQKNVDHFKTAIEGEPVLQLGSFAEIANASAFIKKLQAQGLQAKMHTLYAGQGMNSWLELVQVSNSALAALKFPKSVNAQKQKCP